MNLTVTNAAGSDSEVKPGLITVTPAVLAVPPSTLLPTDTNSDGKYEDVNGNGAKDFADIVLYFNQPQVDHRERASSGLRLQRQRPDRLRRRRLALQQPLISFLKSIDTRLPLRHSPIPVVVRVDDCCHPSSLERPRSPLHRATLLHTRHHLLGIGQINRPAPLRRRPRGTRSTGRRSSCDSESGVDDRDEIDAAPHRSRRIRPGTNK